MPDVDAIDRLAALAIETPSWGYGDSGTRFATFQQPGRPRDVFERVDDAAEVHRLTGTAPLGRAALPVGPGRRLRRAARAHRRPRGLRDRRRQPEPVPGPRLQARLDHAPRRGVRAKAVEHLLECVDIAARAGLHRAVAVVRRRHQLPGPGRPARRAAGGCSTRSASCTPRCPAEQELLVEYKLFEPAFYATDLADWGCALLACQKLGERARVLVDLGHHARA